jgi:hypothetical protein
MNGGYFLSKIYCGLLFAICVWLVQTRYEK